MVPTHDDDYDKLFTIDFGERKVYWHNGDEKVEIKLSVEDDRQFLIVPLIKDPYIIDVVDQEHADLKDNNSIQIFEIDFVDGSVGYVEGDGDSQEVPFKW